MPSIYCVSMALVVFMHGPTTGYNSPSKFQLLNRANTESSLPVRIRNGNFSGNGGQQSMMQRPVGLPDYTPSRKILLSMAHAFPRGPLEVQKLLEALES